MGIEIERKFLVVDDTWRAHVVQQTEIVQGYLLSGADLSIRVRLKGDAAFLTVKGRTEGIQRSEFEYPIPVPDARQMLEQFADGPVIDKVRHLVDVGDHRWEIDVFAGDNQGLVLAEVELGSEDEDFELPGWAGPEVSDDPRYYNVNLARNPFREWGLDAAGG